MMPLGLLNPGEAGEIIAIRSSVGSRSAAGESARSESRIEDLRLRIGCIVEMLNNAGGPVLLKVGESRLAWHGASAKADEITKGWSKMTSPLFYSLYCQLVTSEK